MKTIGCLILGYFFMALASYDVLVQISREQELNSRITASGMSEPDYLINDAITYKGAK